MWNKFKEDPEEDGDIPEGEEVDAESEKNKNKEEETRGEGGGVTVKMREMKPRDFHIRKTDAEKHGYTRGCPGCTTWFKGLSRQPHNERCRERFKEAMKNEAKVERAMEQKEEFERKVEVKRRKKEENKEEKKRKEGGGMWRKAEEGGGITAEGDAEVENGDKEGDREMGQGEDEPEVEDTEEGCEREVKRQRIKQVVKWVQEVRAEVEEEEKEEEDEWMEAWDDVKGGGLKYKEVVEARREEIEFMMKRGIWDLKPIQECWEKTGRGPTGVRWVDTNKGSEERTDVRSRLVARDFSTKADK